MKKLILGAVVSSLSLMACTPPPPLQDTEVRFFNAIPDSSGMDVDINSVLFTPRSTPVDFRAAFPLNSAYHTVKEGTFTYSLCVAEDRDCIGVKNRTVALQGQKKTTLAFIGTRATNDDTGTDARPLDSLTISHETIAPAAGRARLQVVHLASVLAAKTVDLFITDPTATLNNIVPPSISYKATQAYRDFDAGSYRIRVTAPSTPGTVLVDSATLTLEANKTYTAIITNPNVADGNKGVTLLVDK